MWFNNFYSFTLISDDVKHISRIWNRFQSKDLYRSRRASRIQHFSRKIHKGDKEEEGEPEEKRLLSIAETRAKNKEEQQKKWSWISLVWILTGGDITKTELVLQKTFGEVLIWLSYKKENEV